MIVNMSCPKCGGQASEYDEKKWRCLKCGNKFIYAPEAPSQTFVQSNINIHGQAAFELDVQNAKEPVPKTVNRFEHDPNYFYLTYAEIVKNIDACRKRLSSHKGSKLIALSLSIVFGVLAGFYAVRVFQKHALGEEKASPFPAIIFCIITGLTIRAFLINRREIREHISLLQRYQQKIANLDLEKQEVITVGNYTLCPYCDTVFDYVESDNPPVQDGLKHCLGCGKQFCIAHGNSYPVRFT
ncbi:MAG: hypothetical protein PCFJNLEI_01363 [Verrucomicrobiae bacterium]|nr:hypothetical protein [Verrucomicrobiae bacterium]